MEGHIVNGRRWRDDPLNAIPVKLFVGDVHRLSSFPGHTETHRLFDHSITQVCIYGFIIEADCRETYTTFTLDDGTGLIGCFYFHEQTIRDQSSIRLGACVEIQGKLGWDSRADRDGQSPVRTVKVTALDELVEMDLETEAILERIKLNQYYERALPPVFYK